MLVRILQGREDVGGGEGPKAEVGRQEKGGAEEPEGKVDDRHQRCRPGK